MATETHLSESRTPVSRRREALKLRGRLGDIALEVLMFALLLFFLAPTFWMISSSLKVSNEIFATPVTWIPDNPQWGNYLKIFEVLPLWRFTWNTFVVVSLAVIGTVISSAMVAYAFARLNWPGRDIWFSLLLATMMLPDVITLVPRFVLFRNFGWINTWLPLIVPYWTATTAIYVFLMRQFFRGIPYELEQAAMIDGAGRLRILFQLILPLSVPVLATVAVFAIIQHYNDFLNPLIYINSQSLWTLSLALRAYNDTNVSNWELVFAAATFMLFPMVLLFIFAQRYFVQGIATTGFGGR
ncbi:MAG: carbohydrate ABC transporter permease [Chloroflexi bacterium OHK40]